MALVRYITVGRPPVAAALFVARAQVIAKPTGLVDPPPPVGEYDPVPQYNQTAWVRPVGIDYVTWESIVGSSAAAAQAASPNLPVTLTATQVKSVTTNKIITFPAGIFEFQAGLNNYNPSNARVFGIGAGYAPGVRGIVGSGSKSTPGTGGGETVFRPVAPLTQGAPLFEVNRPTAAVLAGFSLYGAQTRGDGIYHQGIFLEDCINATVSNLYLRNCAPGYANFPPGETFCINVYRGHDTTITECEVDGRDLAGARTCASPIGWNGADGFPFDTNARIIRCYVHHGLTSMVTFWQTKNIYTEDLYCYSTGSGTGDLRGAGINHEQDTGVIHHVRPRLYTTSPKSSSPDKTANNGFNFTMNSVIDDCGANMTLEEARWDWQADMMQPMLALSGRYGYAVTTPAYVGRTGGQYMLTPPTVTNQFGDVLTCVRQRNTPSSAQTPNWNNQDPARFFAWST